ncbi:MAG TPA: phosphopentomutase [Deltaproteobacteria bacterium]|nr:MAG: phosphopentomutase [Deltaproteobacteria bacterium GWA2_55_82]OGQ64061.1 MAG: phosphopentomutase [Deltaproteobacteria bacterium RIFCSPLOWO2_02_FULL_55_12]OIJ74511.1 MAG: phosphopentomutase [Deltaproteobacteria bacterium GWC2_55_46]HBG47175.1 phosphopentomutase [Deltaproteobacteria bacterium]HCY10764.1 phosphopentomutase [Deltaproteobacteria bacterium]
MGLFDRAVVIVFDGLGAGEMPDASGYGDSGSDTIDNLSRAVGGLKVPNLSSLGLGRIDGVDTVTKAATPSGSFGRMREASPGKDTATGHWEMMGIVLDRPFPVFPEGFPPEVMERFARETGWGWLWNKTASGTEIIERLGEEHLKTRRLIVYTSADSVFQIAAHEEVIPVPELYRVCEKARKIADDYNIGRVIARPFTGRPGSFARLPARKDYAVPPPGETLLEKIKGAGLKVIGIGKIGDIFAHRGLTGEVHTISDDDGLDKTIEAMDSCAKGLVFTNLVDFDTLYGHRNDATGYGRALEHIDSRIPEVISRLGPRDILFITGDHGCDPTTPSTDHSREYVPLIVFGKGILPGVNLGTRATFADLGATIADSLGVDSPANGKTFLEMLIK